MNQPQHVALILHNEGLLFYDPQIQTWVTREEYLSGNVRQKLQIAQLEYSSGLSDLEPWMLSTLDQNIQTLQAVQPLAVLPPASPEIRAQCAISLGVDLEQLSPAERSKLMNNTIEVRLGMTWIPPGIYQQFISYLFNVQAKVNYIGIAKTWTVSGKVIKSDYCTQRRDALTLLEHGLNQKDPLVYDTTVDDQRVLNAAESEAARSALGRIKQAFRDWLWVDGERAVSLTQVYNERFNSWQIRQYNGSHLTLPGSNPQIQLKPHQKNGVWRILQNQATLLAWTVGSGKTYAMICAAMEARRLGLASKPMIVVLNSTLPQIATEFRKLYPLAKLLVADQESFTKDQRRVFLCQIATGDWDCIILTHTQFFSIPLSTEAELAHLHQEKVQIADLLKGTDDPASTKALESAKMHLENRILTVTQSKRKDGVITWEQLGVKMLILDESQAFKNLRYYTRQRGIAGMSNTHSQRAQDTFMKIQHLLGNGGRVVFSTGTPISNTMAELFTQQRYLDSDFLASQGLDGFDSWSAQYGETVTAPEISPTGKYQVRTRFAQFINVPELLTSFLRFADIQNAEKLGLERPEAIYINESAPPSEDLSYFMDELALRAEKVHNREVEPDEDNMLRITHHGRIASLDMRLIWSKHNPPVSTKVHEAILNIWQIWKIARSVRATQLVFLDLSTPGPHWNVYDYLRSFLIKLGIPSREIAYIHDFPNEGKRKILFDAVNSGQVRILLGSTQKLGTGVNVQKKLIAIHHLDAPWRPSDLEQREGRIIRQGNTFKRAWIFRYVTEGKRGQCGFDAFLWQILELKKSFIDRIMMGDVTERKAEDIASGALNYNQVKALATGDPIIQEKAQVEQKLRQLQLLNRAWEDQQTHKHWERQRLQRKVQTYPGTIKQIQQDLKIIQAYPITGEQFTCTIQSKIYTNRKKAGAALWREINAPAFSGEFAGLKMGRHRINSQDYGLYLQGSGPKYEFTIQETPIGTVMAMQTVVTRRITDQLCELEEDLFATEGRLAAFGPTPAFAEAEQLQILQQRLNEIQEILNRPEEEPPAPEVEEVSNSGDDEEPPQEHDPEASIYVLREIPAQLVTALKNRNKQADWIDQIQKLIGIPETYQPIQEDDLQLNAQHRWEEVDRNEEIQQGCLF